MRFFAAFSIIIIVTSCWQEDVLTENTWFLVNATYNDTPLPINSSDNIKITNNQEYQLLGFSGNGDIVLPGLGTTSVVASWEIIDGRILFVVDSARYHLYGAIDADISFLNQEHVADSIINDATRRLQYIRDIRDNVNATMKYYIHPFEYSVSRDTLVMVSQHTVLIAVRDKSLDEFKKAVTPKFRRSPI